MQTEAQRGPGASSVLATASLCLLFPIWISDAPAQSSPEDDATVPRIISTDPQPTATVVLSGLHRVAEISSAAATSVVSTENRFPHRKHIGVEVPEDWSEDDPVDLNARLVSVEDAEVAVVYYDEHDPTGDNTIIAAGYEYPVSPDRGRKPWLTVKRRNRPAARCEFVIDTHEGSEDGLVDLREVVAIDRRHIYFAAVSLEGDKYLVAARYSIRSNTSAVHSD